MIDARTLQHFLNELGANPGLVEDGDFGPISFATAKSILRDRFGIDSTGWTNGRIYVAVEQLFVNAKTGSSLVVDGLLGPNTNAALAAYTNTVLVVRHVWPRQADVPNYFGPITHENQAYVQCPYPMFGDYRRTIRVKQFECHEKVKASIERILRRTLAHYGAAEIKRLYLDIFSGCRVVRRITSGVGWSMHSWGIAVDIDAGHNPFEAHRSKARMDDPEYAPFVSFWTAEGWTSLGMARDYDWMHFQAARL